jgi:hypothetical protein
VDASNFGSVVIDASQPAEFTYYITKVIAGSETTIRTATVRTPASSGVELTITAFADTSGRIYMTVTIGGTLVASSSGYDSVFATGGTLASGKAGIRDHARSGTADTRSYKNFAAWSAPTDAAMYASQSLEVRHDRVVREDSGGTLWVTPSSYEGDYLLIPPAGAEARTNRFFVKGSRGVPGVTPDTGIDDISATLSFTPRFLVVP